MCVSQCWLVRNLRELGYSGLSLHACVALLFLGGIFMNKTLVSALTTALVVGAASTTFAAANPFSDVPADSWAYDAVAQLAKDGVVDGYGDGTYRGEQNITRYEMAQIVARAMAKQDVSAADKAMIDKLAAEFSDELGNLGVRVANLEKKTDNVKWAGEARYRFVSAHSDNDAAANPGSRQNTNQLLFRLEPSAQVNEHWTAKARIDYYTDGSKAGNINTNQNGDNNNNIQVDRMWAQGEYNHTEINLGKLPFFSAEGGMIFDDRITGGQVTFGKDVKFSLTGGRYDTNENTSAMFGSGAVPPTASILSAEVFDTSKKLTWSAGYHHLSSKDFKAYDLLGKSYNSDNAGIVVAGLGYHFTPTFALNAAYAKNTKGDVDSKFLHAYNVELKYKGAVQDKKGSFGLLAGYRYLGNAAVIVPTYDAIAAGQKGWEFIGEYTFDKNILGTLKYFTGKTLATDAGSSDKNASEIFGELNFFF